MHGYKHLCQHYLHVINVYFNYVVLAWMVKSIDFVPIIAFVGMDIDIFAYNISLLQMFTLTMLYYFE